MIAKRLRLTESQWLLSRIESVRPVGYIRAHHLQIWSSHEVLGEFDRYMYDSRKEVRVYCSSAFEEMEGHNRFARYSC